MDIEEQHEGFDGKLWQVHKFGGTSVADAACFLKVATIIEEQIGIVHDPSGFNNKNEIPSSSSPSPFWNLAIVVSAMGGKPKTTDLLLDSVTAAASRDDEKVESCLKFIQDKHYKCLDTLFFNVVHANVTTSSAETMEMVQSLKDIIAKDLNDIRDILKTVALMKWQAKRISELVSGYGETWSSQILCTLLSKREEARRAEHGKTGGDNFDYQGDNDSDYGAIYNEGNEGQGNHYFRYIDARRIITIDEDAIKDGAVCWELSMDKLKNVYQEESIATFGLGQQNGTMHFVITGYIASNTHAVATTLQRDGSDYSAAIMGRLLESTQIAIWTDVDGVLSADPRRVPHSYVLPEVSFNEAMELAYFGAKVIHPKVFPFLFPFSGFEF